MTKPLSEMESGELGTATSPRPLELKSLLKELTGEDLSLRMLIIEAAVTGSELSFQPSNAELRTRAAKVCVANCYLLPGSTIRRHTGSAQKHLQSLKRPD